MRGYPGRVLFWLGVTLAGMLVALVLLAPLVPESEDTKDGGWGRVVALFGRDSSLRRTSLASAAGLVVTAWVFFRRGAPGAPSRRATGTRRRSSGPAGA